MPSLEFVGYVRGVIHAEVSRLHLNSDCVCVHVGFVCANSECGLTSFFNDEATVFRRGRCSKCHTVTMLDEGNVAFLVIDVSEAVST